MLHENELMLMEHHELIYHSKDMPVSVDVKTKLRPGVDYFVNIIYQQKGQELQLFTMTKHDGTLEKATLKVDGEELEDTYLDMVIQKKPIRNKTVTNKPVKKEFIKRAKQKLKVLVVCTEGVSKFCNKTSAPGIRSWKMAEELAKHFEVGFTYDLSYMKVSKQQKAKLPKNINLIEYRHNGRDPDGGLSKTHGKIFNQYDVMIVQSGSELPVNITKCFHGYLIYDCWIPSHAEFLDSIKLINMAEQIAFWRRWHKRTTAVFSEASLILCANDRQLDYYRGILYGSGAIRPDTPRPDQLLLRVPYGVPVGHDGDTEVTYDPYEGWTDERTLKLLWFSGVYPWFDLKTVVHAIKMVREDNDYDVKLLVKGAVHPVHKGMTEGPIQQVEKLVKSLKLEDVIKFDNSWCKQEEKHNWLRNADVGLAFGGTEEQPFCNRTRLLDFAYNGLYSLSNSGDNVGRILKRYHLGDTCVPTAEQIANKLTRLCSYKIATPRYFKVDKNMRDDHHTFKSDFSWENCIKPLVKKLKEL